MLEDDEVVDVHGVSFFFCFHSEIIFDLSTFNSASSC